MGFNSGFKELTFVHHGQAVQDLDLKWIFSKISVRKSNNFSIVGREFICYSEHVRRKCKPKLLQKFLYFSIMEI